MSVTLYTVAQVLFTGSLLSLLSSELVQLGDKQVQNFLSDGFDDKFGALMAFSVVTVVLGFVPTWLSGYFFNSVLEEPVSQGLALSVLVTWWVLHRQVSDWNVTSITGWRDGLVILVSAFFLLRPYVPYLV
jgi:hypothetical protein